MALIGISVDLFIHASYDARLGFMGAVIGLPTSILITVISNDYFHRRDYIKSITEDLFDIMAILKRIEVKSRQFSQSFTSSSRTRAAKVMSLSSINEITDTEFISELLSNVRSFYKKRKVTVWSTQAGQHMLEKINEEERRSNQVLKPLILNLASLDEVCHQDLTTGKASFVQKTSLKVYQTAKKVRGYFATLSN